MTRPGAGARPDNYTEDYRANLGTALEYGVSPLVPWPQHEYKPKPPDEVPCPECDGKGEVTSWRPSSQDGLMPCPECDGTGVTAA